ncbi:VOC family protein [Paenibacillus sp. FSL E2-0201]|uniref:VOC family protein n=1 Tax=Paenibacillus sp. FSL E2-0201 TaxID=2954726 RepID=UPI0030DC3B90
MKIDHLVVNVDRNIHEDQTFVKAVQTLGLPYEPKWGKGTKGFKVSNIWIGNEYFEWVRIKKKDGGGWLKSWTEDYLGGHRGLIGFALDVEDIDAVYKELSSRNIEASTPEPLRFRWFFNLLNRTMPWKNSYIPKFEGVPFQFFLQQMNDEKSLAFMQQYMVPNSRDQNIQGISQVNIYGAWTQKDKKLLKDIFTDVVVQDGMITISLGSQRICCVDAETYRVEVLLDCRNDEYSKKELEVGNLLIRNR